MNNPEDEDIPDGIGPHEGKELALMLAGEKPAAMFNDDIPESFEPPEIIFAPYVENGQIIKCEAEICYSQQGHRNLRNYFYALPGEEWRIDRLIEIQRSLHEKGEPTTREIEAEIGHLLGYQEQDIQTYLERFFQPSTDEGSP